MKLKDKALRIIESLVSDDFSEKLTYEVALGRQSALPPEDVRIIGNKLATIYKIAHAVREDAQCYAVHDDWRKEINSLYLKYRRANLI